MEKDAFGMQEKKMTGIQFRKGYLEINDDLLEKIEYNTPTMPIKASYSELGDFPGGVMPVHWHKELEFICVEKGYLKYYVNNCAYQLSPGQGLIVNTNRLHLGGPVDFDSTLHKEMDTAGKNGVLPSDLDCRYAVMLLQPDTLRFHRQFEKKYIDPLLYDASSDVILLDGTEEWHEEVISVAMKMFHRVMNLEPYFELTCQSDFFVLWKLLYQNTIEKHGYELSETDPMGVLKRMLSFIQENYQDKITLSDIAEQGMMCQSKCCRLFRETLKQSPMEYLQNYRITKGIYLLEHTNKSVTDIALECGFHGGSYFTETFRKINGITPKEFRRRSKEGME